MHVPEYIHLSVALLLLLGALAPGVSGQESRLVSPEVSTDGRVTFRFLAPLAREVKVTGDFLKEPLPLKKDESGVWSGATKPLAPEIYSYSIEVDGVPAVDPSNPFVQTGAIWLESLVEVPGHPPAFFAARDVAHGSIHRHWYRSKSLGAVRSVVVYTPPGYEEAAQKGRRFPVLYLLHGYGDDETCWTHVGRANFIADNLLADGKIRPALIVMPFGHASAEVRHGPDLDWLESTVSVLEKDLFEDVIPLVESAYRVDSRRESRAIAGLSMGGLQALAIGLNHLPAFAYVAGFSSALRSAGFERMFGSFLKQPAEDNGQLKLLWLGCGDQDDLIGVNRQFEEILKEKNIRHEFVVTGGARHHWPLWRSYLRDLMPKLFSAK